MNSPVPVASVDGYKPLSHVDSPSLWDVLDALNQALEQAGSGHGQIVAAVGEAGVGKSRLIYEFIHSHRTQGWRVLESASVPYGKASPYFPVIDLLKRYVQVEDSDNPRTIRAKVTGHLLTLAESFKQRFR